MAWYIYLLFGLILFLVVGCCLTSTAGSAAEAAGKWGQALAWFGKTKTPDAPRQRSEIVYEFKGNVPQAFVNPAARLV